MVVYVYQNSVNSKVYVGQTGMHFNDRWLKHLSDARRGCNTRFARAMKKYGADAFFLKDKIQLTSKADMNATEQFLIAMYRATEPSHGYNIQAGGHKFGYHTEETKRRMSLAHMGQAPYNKGLHHSPETKAKLSAVGKGRPHSIEHCIKISAALKGRRPSPQCIEKSRLACTGKVFSIERRLEMSKLAREHPAFLGHKHSAEAKEKIAAARRGKPTSAKQKAAVSAANRRRAQLKILQLQTA